jgi:hypothetical protein
MGLTDPTFSQRIGTKPLKKPIQLRGMNRELRTGLWNAVLQCYLGSATDYLYEAPEKQRLFIKVYADLFCAPIDEMPVSFERMRDEIKTNILDQSKWDEVYELIEFLPNNYIDDGDYTDINKIFIEYCNKILARENAGYKFVNKRIAPITSEQEIKEIESAINLSIDPVRTHLDKALELMSDKQKPNYRNSMKESISAVESLLNNIAGKKNLSLTDALNEVIKQKKMILPTSLKLGLEKIYGYTSSSDGIRHSLTEEMDNLTQTDARFMLIMCSAFVNYLKSKTSIEE